MTAAGADGCRRLLPVLLLLLMLLLAKLGLAADEAAFEGLEGFELADVDSVDTFDRSNGSELSSAASASVEVLGPPSTASTARKCCPPGLSMYRVLAPGCDNQVTCRRTDSASSTLWSLQAGGAAGQYGFPTSCPRERCRLVLLDDTDLVDEPHCVDKLVETDHSGQAIGQVMAGMACRQGTTFEDGDGGKVLDRMRMAVGSANATAPVALFRKCCAVHEAYDLGSRRCLNARLGPSVDDAVDGDLDGDLSGDFSDDATVPPLDYESQLRSASALMTKAFPKNLSAIVNMTFGFPDCETDGAYDREVVLDVAVFDLPWDEALVGEDGVLRLRPASSRPSRGPGVDADEDALLVLGPGDYCVDEVHGDAYPGALAAKACLRRADAERAEACSRFGCFRKCCPQHEMFAPSHDCTPRPLTPKQQPRRPLTVLRPQVHSTPALNLSDAEGYSALSPDNLVAAAHRQYLATQRPQQVTFAAVVHNICPDFRFRLDEAEDLWFLGRFGVLYQPDWPETSTLQYCLDDAQDMHNLSVLMCLSETDPTQEEENSRILVITVGLLISCIFLAATLATYCCLPALQNLHGKTLMCHVSSLLVAYLFLALTQLLTKPVFLHNEWVCSIIGNCVLFTFLSAFSWLNVMCFDIWRTFGGLTSSRTLKRSSASRRFRWYCAYAWGLSSLITLVCVAVDQWPGNERSVFRPQIGDGSCWFRTEANSVAYGILIFFVGPLLVQTCCNLVLFVLTVRNYSRIKSEINRLHTAPNSHKVKKFQANANKLKMNVKLFVVMGVTWVLELVSTFFPPDHPVFYVSDAANALQGVMIFAIFVLKRKVLNALAVRLGRAPAPPPYSASPSISADCRLATGLAVRGKTTSTNTLFSSDFRCSAFSAETAH